MIVARGEGADKRHIILLGITKKNMASLLRGEHLEVTGEKVGFVGNIVIVGGDDELSISRDLSSAMKADAVLKVG